MKVGLESVSVPFSSVQSLNHVWLFVTPWTAACQASLSFTISRNLPKFMSIESVMPINLFILCCPLLHLPSVFRSIRVFFSSESAVRIRWPKYWSFSSNPSNEYSRLTSFRTDWFDILAVQETLKIFSSTTVQKHQLFSALPSLWSKLSHLHVTTGNSPVISCVLILFKIRV